MRAEITYSLPSFNDCSQSFSYHQRIVQFWSSMAAFFLWLGLCSALAKSAIKFRMFQCISTMWSVNLNVINKSNFTANVLTTYFGFLMRYIWKVLYGLNWTHLPQKYHSRNCSTAFILFNSCPLDKITAISQTIFSDAFSRMKLLLFCCEIGHKPLSEPMPTRFADTYMWH